jgi:AcrR family transcriptional regulator
MGRRSLAEQRCPQILDAVQTCLVKYGLAGTTLPRIAEEAGMATSIIRHYLGDKNAVIRAAVERSLDNVRAALTEATAGAPPEKRLAIELDVMFDRRFAVPEINQIVDELVAASYFDEFTLDQLTGLYRRLQRGLRVSVAAAYPDAPAHQIDVVVHGLLALGHAGATFGWLGFDRAHYRKLRAAADALVATLEPTPVNRP